MEAVQNPVRPLSPRVRSLLDLLHAKVTPDLSGPTDLQATVELLERLFSEVHPPTPLEVAAYLQATHGWRRTPAHRVAQICEAIFALRQVQTGRVYPLFSLESH
ncbi:MAG: hypothetical protein ACK47B_17125 [Armatimonadota bacterium]